MDSFNWCNTFFNEWFLQTFSTPSVERLELQIWTSGQGSNSRHSNKSKDCFSFFVFQEWEMNPRTSQPLNQNYELAAHGYRERIWYATAPWNMLTNHNDWEFDTPMCWSEETIKFIVKSAYYLQNLISKEWRRKVHYKKSTHQHWAKFGPSEFTLLKNYICQKYKRISHS